VIAGNFTKQPVNKLLNSRIHGDLPIADEIHINGLYLGNHPKSLDEELTESRKIIEAFIKN
jgi:hypothetical protein